MCHTVAQAVPLSVKAEGLAKVPLEVPWNPKVARPPAANSPLWLTLLAVTAPDDPERFAFQAPVICCPEEGERELPAADGGGAGVGDVGGEAALPGARPVGHCAGRGASGVPGPPGVPLLTVEKNEGEITEALVIGAEQPHGGYRMPLFVVLAAGVTLDDALRDKIRDAIRTGTSPRHVPDEILEVPGVPHTRTGKKLEVPVKRLLQGAPAEQVVSPAVVDAPDLIEHYARLGAERRSRQNTEA